MSGTMRMTRRSFLRLAGIGIGSAAFLPHLRPAFAAPVPFGHTRLRQAGQSLLPGSPTHARGWATAVPNAPAGLPYNPPIQITSSRNTVNLEFVQGDSFEENPFTRLVKEELGIEWKTKFTYGTADERTQKYNLAMASGDLPDFLEAVPLTNFLDMLEAGLLEDITDVYEEVASDLVKRNLSWNNNFPWIYAEVDGRKMGFPFLERASQNDKLLWVRQDWLDKLGLQPPTTLDELEEVARAFIENGLGQGASGTTIGLNACLELRTWYASLDPVFGGYGVIHDYWLKGEDGSLVHGAIMPEMVEPLKLLNKWYSEGILPADFDTKQAWEQNAVIASNQCGMVFAPYFGGVYGASDSVKNDPEARWAFYDPPAGPKGIGKAWTNPVGQFVHCFRKGFNHVDAVIQMTNWMAEWYEVPNQSRMHGWETYNYTWLEGDKIERVGDQDLWRYWPYGVIGNSASTGTSVFRGSEDDQTATGWMALSADQLDAAQEFALLDPTGLTPAVRNSYIHATQVAEEQGIKNEFYGLSTPGMRDYEADLNVLRDSTFLGMIKGTIPLTEFDAFVREWKAQGGDQITAEVNEWYAAKS